MKIEQIKKMSEVELNAEVKKLKNELFNLRFQHVTGQLENPIKMRDIKKDIARCKTVLREKQMNHTEG
ncbi:MAG: 50S ribosomal protein L29 [Firmicutes bacterium]|nr:50S ribosomal protein L29 [Bacillota bacterium]